VIAAPYDLQGHMVVATASIGIAMAPIDGIEADELLKNADMALYGAKADRRGVYRFFEPKMDARMKARRALELSLRKALANDEFELYYQPAVNLDGETVQCCEALLRWNHPEQGLIMPSDFIPIAEEIGLIVRSANG
jgi:predicted signal transduction protein with EAL and GGDEF domain